MPLWCCSLCCRGCLVGHPSLSYPGAALLAGTPAVCPARSRVYKARRRSGHGPTTGAECRRVLLGRKMAGEEPPRIRISLFSCVVTLLRSEGRPMSGENCTLSSLQFDQDALAGRQETGDRHPPHFRRLPGCLGLLPQRDLPKNTPATSCSNEWSIVHQSFQRAMHPTTDERTTRARIVAGEREGREGAAKAGAVAASSQPWKADACESHRPSSCMFIDRTTCPRRQDRRHHETEHRE